MNNGMISPPTSVRDSGGTRQDTDTPSSHGHLEKYENMTDLTICPSTYLDIIDEVWERQELGAPQTAWARDVKHHDALGIGHQ
jgi:hypothetical protein